MKSRIALSVLLSFATLQAFAMSNQDVETCSQNSELIQSPNIKNAIAAFTFLAYVRADIKSAYMKMADKMDKAQTCQDVEAAVTTSLKEVKTLLEKNPQI